MNSTYQLILQYSLNIGIIKKVPNKNYFIIRKSKKELLDIQKDFRNRFPKLSNFDINENELQNPFIMIKN